MVFKNKMVIICNTILLLSFTSLVLSEESLERNEGNTEFGAGNNALTDDEISYALSELSVDDLKTLNKLMDVISQEGDIGEIGDESYFNSQAMSDEFSRFKRDSPVKNDQNNVLSNVDEEYIRQLDDSFPNAIDQANQEDKDKTHIRVKRD